MGNEPADDGIFSVCVCPVIYRHTARRLSEYDDAGRVAPEAGDVIAHPFHGHALVSEAKVLRRLGASGEAKDVESIGNRHNDDILFTGQDLAVVERTVAVPNGESSTVEENKHRLELVAGVERLLSPDVES